MNHITSTITYGNSVSFDSMDDWMRKSHPWTVQLRYKRRQFTFPFYTGQLHGEPTTFDAAYCVLSDASGIESSLGFEDWAEMYGYDTDSRKAERLYNECVRISRNMKRLLGDDYHSFVVLDEDLLSNRCK